MKNQNKHYQQLTQEPRYQISALHKTGMSLSAIAEQVGVHTSTISRELRRNVTAAGYDQLIAQQMSECRKETAHKAHKRTATTDPIIGESLALGTKFAELVQSIRRNDRPRFLLAGHNWLPCPYVIWLTPITWGRFTTVR